MHLIARNVTINFNWHNMLNLRIFEIEMSNESYLTSCMNYYLAIMPRLNTLRIVGPTEANKSIIHHIASRTLQRLILKNIQLITMDLPELLVLDVRNSNLIKDIFDQSKLDMIVADDRSNFSRLRSRELVKVK